MDEEQNQYKQFGFPEIRGPNKDRHAVLERNARIRIEQPQVALPGMKMALTIPLLDWAVLRVRFPELDCSDAQIRRQAWVTFHNHPASEPYRMTKHGYKF